MTQGICRGGREGFEQLINIGMEDPVDEAYGGRLVGVCVWELYVDFPLAACEGC